MQAGTPILFVIAALEVAGAALRGRIRSRERSMDGMNPQRVPGIASGDRRERRLAWIDQDGFLIAIDARDAAAFPGREQSVPRTQHSLDVWLLGNELCLVKTFPALRVAGISGRLRSVLRLELLLEAAALLRLEARGIAPRLRGFSWRRRTLAMEFLDATDLRHVLSGPSERIDYVRLQADYAVQLRSEAPSSAGAGIRALVRQALECGVAPRDLHAANVMRGNLSGRLYLVDHHCSHLQPAPGWRQHASTAWRAVAAEERT